VHVVFLEYIIVSKQHTLPLSSALSVKANFLSHSVGTSELIELIILQLPFFATANFYPQYSNIKNRAM
jgi:hypothetical protein